MHSTIITMPRTENTGYVALWFIPDERSIDLINQARYRKEHNIPGYLHDTKFRIKITNLMVQLAMSEGKFYQAHYLIKTIENISGGKLL